MEFVYVAQDVDGGCLMGVYPSWEALFEEIGERCPENNGWSVRGDLVEAELLAPDGHNKDALVVATRCIVRPEKGGPFWRLREAARYALRSCDHHKAGQRVDWEGLKDVLQEAITATLQ